MEFGPVIKNPVLDINKLVRQGTMLNQGVQNVEGDSTADQATVDLLARKDPVIQEISVGMSGEELTQYTVSGTPPLSLPNSIGKPLKAWEVGLEPYQDLHGYDSPWPAGGGKNLLQILPTESTVSNGVTFTVNADGTISTQGTASGTAVFRHYITASDLPTGEDLALNGVPSGGGWTTIYGLAFCNARGAVIGEADSGSGTTISASRLSELAQVQIVVRDGINANGKLFTPMIRLASITDSSFAPYENLCPISGTDKVNLFVEVSYDPTATPKAVITLPQTVYTGTIGSEGGESRRAVVTLDGNTPTNVFSVTALPNYTQVSYTPYIGVGVAGHDFICSTLKSGTDGLYQIWGSSIPRLFMGLPTSVTNAAEAVAWFADNPTQIVYPLATPTEFTVTDPPIPTPTGTATTWATAEDGTVESMEVTYVGKA